MIIPTQFKIKISDLLRLKNKLSNLCIYTAHKELFINCLTDEVYSNDI